MNPIFQMLADQVRAFWQEVREEGAATGFLPLLRPVAPYDGAVFQNPLATAGILLALAVTSGVAIAAIGVLLVAMLVFWFLLTEVLGISIEVKPFPL